MTSTEIKNAQIALNLRYASAGTWRKVSEVLREGGGGYFHHAYLCMVASGKRLPSRSLLNALDARVLSPTDRVRFAVWITREEREEIERKIESAGTCRHEWLMDLARDIKRF